MSGTSLTLPGFLERLKRGWNVSRRQSEQDRRISALECVRRSAAF